ncbi:hypothetical protein PVK06_002375 [Gossypium arboreum]|uniref:Uncharacterized protein n=1 Tax=Gossypium arboreum TaxID=29729 RepID=A0ABR0R3K2_GOSAR|nr:hypothetical protein PVK06_002375 [Gossypium arboreum]
MYVNHEIDIVIFADNDLILVVATVEGAGDGNEGGDIAGSKGGERVAGLNEDSIKVTSSECGEGGEGLGGEGVELLEVKMGAKVTSSKGGEGTEVANSKGGEGAEVESGEDGKGAEGLNRDGAKGTEVAGSKGGKGVEGLSGDGVEVSSSQYGESGEGSEGIEVAGSQGGEGGESSVGFKGLDGLDASFERLEEGDKVFEEIKGEKLNDRVNREEEGNETEYFDSNDHGSILGSDDDDNTNACRRRSRFPTYNPNSASSHFFIGIVFKDGKCRRAKKMVKDKLAGNFVQEFVVLWDYADELRLKNPKSTINMEMNRVTSEPPPHFKRFYVCFEALKRGGLHWFLNLLTADLGMEDGFGYSIINDEKKGLEISIMTSYLE